MSAKHTPGPWKLGPNSIDVRDGHEDNIVTLPYHEHIASETQEANARLIAAAPELLEMTCAFRQFLTDYLEKPYFMSSEVAEEMFKLSCAAIRKAEGGK